MRKISFLLTTTRKAFKYTKLSKDFGSSSAETPADRITTSLAAQACYSPAWPACASLLWLHRRAPAAWTHGEHHKHPDSGAGVAWCPSLFVSSWLVWTILLLLPLVHFQLEKVSPKWWKTPCNCDKPGPCRWLHICTELFTYGYVVFRKSNVFLIRENQHSPGKFGIIHYNSQALSAHVSNVQTTGEKLSPTEPQSDISRGWIHHLHWHHFSYPSCWLFPPPRHGCSTDVSANKV